MPWNHIHGLRVTLQLQEKPSPSAFSHRRRFSRKRRKQRNVYSAIRVSHAIVGWRSSRCELQTLLKKKLPCKFIASLTQLKEILSCSALYKASSTEQIRHEHRRTRSRRSEQIKHVNIEIECRLSRNPSSPTSSTSSMATASPPRTAPPSAAASSPTAKP